MNVGNRYDDYAIIPAGGHGLSAPEEATRLEGLIRHFVRDGYGGKVVFIQQNDRLVPGLMIALRGEPERVVYARGCLSPLFGQRLLVLHPCVHDGSREAFWEDATGSRELAGWFVDRKRLLSWDNKTTQILSPGDGNGMWFAVVDHRPVADFGHSPNNSVDAAGVSA